MVGLLLFPPEFLFSPVFGDRMDVVFASFLLGQTVLLLHLSIGVALNSSSLGPTNVFSGGFCLDPDYGVCSVGGPLGYDTLGESDLVSLVGGPSLWRWVDFTSVLF